MRQEEMRGDEGRGDKRRPEETRRQDETKGYNSRGGEGRGDEGRRQSDSVSGGLTHTCMSLKHLIQSMDLFSVEKRMNGSSCRAEDTQTLHTPSTNPPSLHLSMIMTFTCSRPIRRQHSSSLV